MDPPETYWDIPEGSCAEAVLWTVINAHGVPASQREINRAGGEPGRGLYNTEIPRVLRKYRIAFKDLTRNGADYRGFLYGEVIDSVLRGHPVLLGVKEYPDNHPEWTVDHFILVVGYDVKDDLLIYNSNNRREELRAEELLDNDGGYSLLSRHRYLFALEFPLEPRDSGRAARSQR
jgi:hypothetical protein